MLELLTQETMNVLRKELKDTVVYEEISRNPGMIIQWIRAIIRWGGSPKELITLELLLIKSGGFLSIESFISTWLLHSTNSNPGFFSSYAKFQINYSGTSVLTPQAQPLFLTCANSNGHRKINYDIALEILRDPKIHTKPNTIFQVVVHKHNFRDQPFESFFTVVNEEHITVWSTDYSVIKAVAAEVSGKPISNRFFNTHRTIDNLKELGLVIDRYTIIKVSI